MERLCPKDGFTSFQIGQAHAALGNAQEAIDALATAQARGYYIKSEQRNTEFDFLRGLPAFQKLLQ